MVWLAAPNGRSISGSPPEIDRSGRAQLLSKREPARGIIGLVGNVAEAYFDLRALDLQVDITKRALKSWEASVRISRLSL